MWRIFVLSFFVLACKPSGAQVDYVKRSELWGYTMGQEAAKGMQHHQDFKGHMSQRDADYRKLDDLKQRLAKCGNCAEKNKLAADAAALEKRLTNFDRQLCAGFAAQSSNPAAGAMSKLLGVAPICDKLEAQSSKASAEAKAKSDKQDFDNKVKAGDNSAYFMMGQNQMNRRELPIEERQRLACPYWFQGARQGDVVSTTSLSSLCLSNLASEKDRKEGFDLVKRCADGGEARCIHSLGWHYASKRNKNSAPIVSTNDDEALRLWDMAAAKGDANSAKDARALRVRLQMSGSSSEPKAMVVADSVPAATRESGIRPSGGSTAGNTGSTRCGDLAKVVENVRVRAESGKKIWTDAYDRQKQKYARECGGG